MTNRALHPADITLRPVDNDDLGALQNICIVAADKFAANAAAMRRNAGAATPPGGSLVPTGPAAAALAEQFEQQEAQARAFAALFVDAQPFQLPLEAEELAG